jgi:hypothetical protein
MGAVMDLARKLHDRILGRALATGLALLVIGCATARGGPAIALAATATAAATTPTTTYAPSGGAAAPGGTPAATPSTASAPPAAGAPATGAPATSTPATPGAQAATPAQGSAAQTKTGKGDRPLSTGAIVIAVLAAMLVLACAAWALARSTAFEPHWLLSLRHAMAEAGFRASATWSEFADWARLGR